MFTSSYDLHHHDAHDYQIYRGFIVKGTVLQVASAGRRRSDNMEEQHDIRVRGECEGLHLPEHWA